MLLANIFQKVKRSFHVNITEILTEDKKEKLVRASPPKRMLCREKRKELRI